MMRREVEMTAEIKRLIREGERLDERLEAQCAEVERLQSALDAAIAAERERCARIVETWPVEHWQAIAPHIAAAIRKGE